MKALPNYPSQILPQTAPYILQPNDVIEVTSSKGVVERYRVMQCLVSDKPNAPACILGHKLL